MRFQQLVDNMERIEIASGEAARFLQNWCVEEMIRLNRPIVALEIGTWCGFTALAMAATGANVICVDTFQGSDPQTAQRAGTLRGTTLDRFLCNAIALQPRGSVVGLVGDSVHISKLMPDGVLDLIFVDGAHEQDAVTADLDAWWPKLRPGGVFCGHDIGQPSVSVPVIAKGAAIGRTLETLPDQTWRLR